MAGLVDCRMEQRKARTLRYAVHEDRPQVAVTRPIHRCPHGERELVTELNCRTDSRLVRPRIDDQNRACRLIQDRATEVVLRGEAIVEAGDTLAAQSRR